MKALKGRLVVKYSEECEIGYFGAMSFYSYCTLSTVDLDLVNNTNGFVLVVQQYWLPTFIGGMCTFGEVSFGVYRLRSLYS